MLKIVFVHYSTEDRPIRMIDRLSEQTEIGYVRLIESELPKTANNFQHDEYFSKSVSTQV